MSTAITLSRRSALTLGAGAALMPFVAGSAFARDGAKLTKPATFVYNLSPVQIADGVWMVPGARDKITPQNGGAIANVIIFDTKDGAVILDTGPSHRYGMELASLSHLLTGKPTARVYITHIHSDHSLGATAFDPSTLYGADGLNADMKLRGNDITTAMYRVAGDWMRDTNVPDIEKVASKGVEDIGERRFRCMPMAGHTANDLALYEERSGLLLAGDLVFLDRAPTTPDADLPKWRASLAALADIPHAKLVPGHGPAEPGRRGIDQTRKWLDFVDDRISTQFDAGNDETEMMSAAVIPSWADDIAVARYEFQRSVMHLTPRLELARLPALTSA